MLESSSRGRIAELMPESEQANVARTRCMKCGAEKSGWLETPAQEDDQAYERWKEPCGECGWSPIDLGCY
jgi:hypothetical protein